MVIVPELAAVVKPMRLLKCQPIVNHPLKDYLPETLVKNRNIYSILSKGIHTLTEDECLGYFSTIHLGIKLILDEEIERREREKTIKELTDEIGRIKGELGGAA